MPWTRDDTLRVECPLEMPELEVLRIATRMGKKDISSKVLIDVKRIDIHRGWQRYQVIVYAEE